MWKHLKLKITIQAFQGSIFFSRNKENPDAYSTPEISIHKNPPTLQIPHTDYQGKAHSVKCNNSIADINQ